MSRPAVFFDRDGTLCREQGYVNHPDRLELLPRTDATVTYTVTTASAAGDQPLTVRTTPTCQAAR